MDHNRTIASVLADLISVNNERIHAYEKATHHKLNDDGLRILFMGMIDQGRRIRNELVVELQLKGLSMKDEIGKDSFWKRMGGIFSHNNPGVTLKHCCSVESKVQDAYEDALGHELPSYLRDLFKHQKEELMASWQEMRSFQHH